MAQTPDPGAALEFGGSGWRNTIRQACRSSCAIAAA
jgi:hypothetical protein